MAYVVKEWFADETPSPEGVHVKIKGREGGLVSFLLSLLGIDPTVMMIVDKENVRFEEGSWSGFFQRITPINKLCSGGYGYTKPWKPALVMALIGFPLITFFGLGLVLIIGAVVYYFLNKQLRLEFSDVGGKTSGIAFKRSVIEGIKIDEQEAARVIHILEALTQRKTPEKEATPLAPRPSPVRKLSPSAPQPVDAQAVVTENGTAGMFCPECGARNASGSPACASCGASLT